MGAYDKNNERKKSKNFSGKFSDKGFDSKPGRRQDLSHSASRSAASSGKKFDEELANGSVPGRNAVRELLKSGRDIEKIFIQSDEREGSITVLAAEALSRGIPLIEVERKKLDALCGYEQHQGIVAIASEKEYVDIEDVLEIARQRGEKPLIVIADGVSDPHNLGAIIEMRRGCRCSRNYYSETPCSGYNSSGNQGFGGCGGTSRRRKMHKHHGNDKEIKGTRLMDFCR